LPAPYFPFVVPSESATPVLARIAKQQAAVVRSTAVDGYQLKFTVASTVAVDREESGIEFWAAALAYCKAERLRVTHPDAVAKTPHQDKFLRALVNKDAAPFDAKTAAQEVSSEKELTERFATWLQDQAYPQYDLSSDPRFVADPVAFAEEVLSSAAARFKAAKVALAARLAPEAAPVDGGTAAPVATGADTAGRIHSDIVGITGNTKRWKDDIKSFAARVGGRAVWDGTAECWNVPYGAWLKMLELRPDVAAELQIVESSGKLSYGRRRR
jgi:hypothetical protein